jgi:homoserine kinase type II
MLADARIDQGGGFSRQVEMCLHKVVVVSHSASDDTAASGFSERVAAVIVGLVALFTALDPQQLAEIGARYRIGSPVETKPIAAGTINSNFSLQTERGRYFLRINEGKSLEDVAWEAQLLDWLAHHGFPTLAPLLTDSGAGYLDFQGKLLTLFPWSTGHHLAASAVTSRHASSLGQALGRLHRLGAQAPPSWLRRSIYDQSHLRVRFNRVIAHCDPSLLSAVAILQRAMDEAEQSDAVRRASAETLVHGDLFRDNVLWDENRLVAILDFEQASGGTVAYDLAVCLNDWCWDGAPRPTLVAALIEGYQRERTLTTADRLALPVEVRASAMRFTITRITDVYLARVDNPEKDFRDFLARLEAWQSLLLGQFLGSV